MHAYQKDTILSIFLVIAVLFVFLRGARATLIPAVAVPVSLVGTFAVIDNLSLMTLTIASGFVARPNLKDHKIRVDAVTPFHAIVIPWT